jgi:dCMP deaminase
VQLTLFDVGDAGAVPARRPGELGPTRSEKWDARLRALARHIAAWSKDPSTQVGAVIADANHRIVSVGYNGFPAGVDDDDVRLQDRATKLLYTVHAETNAVLFARRDLAGCTLYTWPFMPCARCAVLIIQSGLSAVVAPATPPALAVRWDVEVAAAETMLREAGVTLDLYAERP